jgi:hypothetical protein
MLSSEGPKSRQDLCLLQLDSIKLNIVDKDLVYFSVGISKKAVNIGGKGGHMRKMKPFAASAPKNTAAATKKQKSIPCVILELDVER